MPSASKLSTSILPPDIVLAPRTPTPPESPTRDNAETPSTLNGDRPAHGRQNSYGLGLTHTHSSQQNPSQSSIYYDPSTTSSPVKMLSPEYTRSSLVPGEEPPPTTISAYFTPSLSSSDTPSLQPTGNVTNPFNFQPVSMSKSPITKPHMQSNISARRGHKYKHSSHHSMSHLPIAEPSPTRPLLSLPASLPIPTLAEGRASMTTDQKFRLYWSIVHMLVAAHVVWTAHGSAAMEALSHLIFYDSLGAALTVFVEVWSNFEVWGRSSVRHPFGLQRMEVIAGFALSVLLIFFGFDLISHNAKHALEGLGSHEPHHTHSHHDRVSAGTVDVTVLLAFVSTLISAIGLKNHARIGKAMRFAAMEDLPLPQPLHSILSNPSHFLTLSCSTTLLLLPLLDLHTYEMIDQLLSLSIALAMLFLGVHLGKNVGGMLLMSYPGNGVTEVISDIEADPLVQRVSTAKFWQAHYGVGIANLRLRVGSVGGEEGALMRLRERIVGLISNRLSGGYGAAGWGMSQKWEVSVEFEVDGEGVEDEAFSHSHSHHGHGHGHGLNVHSRAQTHALHAGHVHGMH